MKRKADEKQETEEALALKRRRMNELEEKMEEEIEEVSCSDFEALPRDIFLEIIQYLSVKDLYHLMEVNKSFYDDEGILLEITKKLGIKKDWHSELNDDLKLKLSSFLILKQQIKEDFPPELIDVFGLSNMAQFPIMDIGSQKGETGYIDFITPEQMGPHSVAYGLDFYKRPFISFQYKIKNHPFYEPKEPIWVETLFQRNSDSKSTWVIGGGCSVLKKEQGELTLHPAFLSYLKKLSAKEECESEYDSKIQLYEEKIEEAPSSASSIMDID